MAAACPAALAKRRSTEHYRWPAGGAAAAGRQALARAAAARAIPSASAPHLPPPHLSCPPFSISHHPTFSQCSINLKDNLLRFGSSGEALPFLPEHEIPKSASPGAPGGRRQGARVLGARAGRRLCAGCARGPEQVHPGTRPLLHHSLGSSGRTLRLTAFLFNPVSLPTPTQELKLAGGDVGSPAQPAPSAAGAAEVKRAVDWRGCRIAGQVAALQRTALPPRARQVWLLRP